MEWVDKYRAELFISARCNLACDYCFIHKSGQMEAIDQKIREELDSNGLIEKLLQAYGENLEELDLWGGETTLNLEYLTVAIPDLFKRLGKLKEINFSSNFTWPETVNKLLQLIETINANLGERPFTLKVQISVDGPNFITDRTRGNGVLGKISTNLESFLDVIRERQLKKNFQVWINFKATLPMAIIRELTDDPAKLSEYWRCFARFAALYKSRYLPANIHLVAESGTPTVVIPGDFSADDGRIFARFLRRYVDEALNNKDRFLPELNLTAMIPYLGRIRLLYSEIDQFRIQNRGLACGASARGFALGIDGDIHICHRSYFLEQDEHVKQVMEQMDQYEQGRLRLFRENQIVKVTDNYNFLRQQYTINCYRDFAPMSLQYLAVCLKTLAAAGQADPVYLKNDEYTQFTALFIKKATNCTIESALLTGSFHLNPLQLIKLWGNGAFTELLNCHERFRKEGVMG